eukprot:357241-Chlamydomonas_euryale.AAC.2
MSDCTGSITVEDDDSISHWMAAASSVPCNTLPYLRQNHSQNYRGPTRVSSGAKSSGGSGCNAAHRHATTGIAVAVCGIGSSRWSGWPDCKDDMWQTCMRLAPDKHSGTDAAQPHRHFSFARTSLEARSIFIAEECRIVAEA